MTLELYAYVIWLRYVIKRVHFDIRTALCDMTVYYRITVHYVIWVRDAIWGCTMWNGSATIIYPYFIWPSYTNPQEL